MVRQILSGGVRSYCLTGTEHVKLHLKSVGWRGSRASEQARRDKERVFLE